MEYIQITLDGINEEYNKIKNYIYTDIDAFITLVENIHNLLNKSKCKVNIKINATNENIKKLYDNILFLKEEFKEYVDLNRISFNIAALYSYCKDSDNGTEEFWNEFSRLGEVANNRTPNMRERALEKETFKREFVNYPCSSYVGKTYFIMPNGELVRCGLIRKEDIYGDIYNGVTKPEVLEAWHNFDISEISFCKKTKCPYHPMCFKFIKCDSFGMCTKIQDQEKSLIKVKERLIRTYNFYNNIKKII